MAITRGRRMNENESQMLRSENLIMHRSKFCGHGLFSSLYLSLFHFNYTFAAGASAALV